MPPAAQALTVRQLLEDHTVIPWRRGVWRVCWPVLRPLLKLAVAGDDPWTPVNQSVPFYALGRGSIRRFSWYFEGKSTVEVGSVEAVCDWLKDCEYVSDPELFNEPDFWQHPRTFEQLRKGDCEDHALWAWRKLVHLGVPADFYVGRLAPGSSVRAGHHAWVVIDDNGRRKLLESVCKGDDPMILDLQEVAQQYVPFFSVDKWYRARSYVGYLLHMLETDNGRIEPRGAV